MILGNKKAKKSDVNPLVIVLFAGIVIGFYGIYKIYKGYESQNWPTTQGKIIDSRLAGAKRTIGRKIKEFVLAIQIEKKYTKDEILQMYLNEAP